MKHVPKPGNKVPEIQAPQERTYRFGLSQNLTREQVLAEAKRRDKVGLSTDNTFFIGRMKAYAGAIGLGLGGHYTVPPSETYDHLPEPIKFVVIGAMAASTAVLLWGVSDFSKVNAIEAARRDSKLGQIREELRSIRSALRQLKRGLVGSSVGRET